MAWIEQTPPSRATGLLKRLVDQALARAGRVWNITGVMSVNPPVMRDATRLYLTLMTGESPLSRAQREMLATVVAAEVGCHY